MKRPIMHIDIPTANRAATAQFYATLFGWEIGQDKFPYTWFMTGNVSGGLVDLEAGLVREHEVVRAGDVVLYLPSDNIEADLQNIVALGGTILMPRTYAGKGQFVALFADPNGVRLGLAGGR